MNNTEKTLKNSIISVVSQILTLLLQFVNRRVFIIFLDIEYLGYQSLFSNIFNLLSVAELGIGNIIAFHMYKEIVENNTDEIGRLMYLYKWMYRIVAVVVCVFGIICGFFLPYIITNAAESWEYLYLIYLLQLVSVVFGYFLSYKRMIYIATQQEYKCVQIDLYVTAFIQIAQLGLLAIFHNYIIYLCMQLSTSVIANIVISCKSDKDFPYLKEKYSVSREYVRSRNMFADLRDFLIHKISYAVYGGTDNIIISTFCGVRSVALYGNYILVQRGVMQVLFYRFLNPVQATIGNIVYSNRSKKELWKQFEVFDVFSFFFASYIAIGFYIFYQPFIQIWLGEDYLLSEEFVALFSITIYLGAIWEIVYKYRSVFGDYKQDRNLMLLSAVLNIAVSIPGANIYGITGVQFGTLVAYLPIAYGRIRFVVKNFFGQSIWKYLFRHMCLMIIAVAEGTICYKITKKMPVNVSGIVERGIVWLFIPLSVNSLIYCRNPYFKQLLGYGRSVLRIIIAKIKRRTNYG